MKKLLLAFALSGGLGSQTRVAEDQIRWKIRLIEWQRCAWQSPDGKVSCQGLEWVRFQMADGSVRGPYLMVAPGLQYQHDPSKWEVVADLR